MGKEDPFLKIGEENDRRKVSESDYVWALKDINFEVEQGDVVGIIGRNGAGKSTLLKILSRTTAPTTGSVKVKGRIASLLEVGTGFHGELSGRENIYLNGAIMGLRKWEIDKKLDEIIDFAGVEKYLDTPVKRYSSGMYVRLAFAVAAYLEPDILIVDEVLAVGDAEFQKKCLGKMKDVSQGQGRTVLFVSHNMEAVKKICKQGIILDKGSIAGVGSIENIYHSYLRRINFTLQSRTSVFDYKIHENIIIHEFTLSKNIINSFSNLNFNVKIESNLNNAFESLCILIYNSEGQRVSIIDLRSFELFSISNKSNFINVKGEVISMPLVFGDYTLGLAIGSKLFTGDVLHLVSLSVNQQELDPGQTQYPQSSLGFINLKYNFKYE